MIIWWRRKTVEDLTIEETLKLMSKEICTKLEIEPINFDQRKEVETFSGIAVTILEKRGFCKNKIYVVQYDQHSRHE